MFDFNIGLGMFFFSILIIPFNYTKKILNNCERLSFLIKDNIQKSFFWVPYSF